MAYDYAISSNPPNVRTSFRAGDWICISPKCAAHNFGRNLACIGCGCSRPTTTRDVSSSQSLQQPIYNTPSGRTPTSPRFSSLPSQPYTSLLSHPVQILQQSSSLTPSPLPLRKQSLPSSTGSMLKPAHPLLTPSGRAFAVGGRVQNISADPFAPCIMYWPDNEPFPEQGQIRPGNISGIAPPILNTGNKGPISHQPGDWVCLKCNYLNWRRRKVCQTCLPYAEGNGDSISAAVQAERIALLTSVLAQTHNQNQMNSSDGQPRTAPPYSPTPLQRPRPTNSNISPTSSVARDSFAHVDHYVNSLSRPIYQTSGHHHHPLPPPSPPLYSTGPPTDRDLIPTLPVAAPHLPSFLQDIVQSPTLSPSSTSSADLSSGYDEYEYDIVAPMKISFPGTRGDCEGDSGVQDLRVTVGGGSSPPYGNIWKMDGEECKSLTAGFTLPLPVPGNRQAFLGGVMAPGGNLKLGGGLDRKPDRFGFGDIPIRLPVGGLL